MKIINFKELPESDVVVDYTIKRFKQGLGTTIFSIGLSGTGKSSVSMRLGELISLKLHGENRMYANHIIDSLVGLLGFVRGVEKLGEVCVVEEISVLFPSRRAMQRDNVAVGKIMDTIRKKQIILLANAPLLGSMDSHMRAMGNILVETLRINKKDRVVVSKALRLQTNPRSGKTYLHRFKRDGREVHRIFTKMPNLKLWREYERNKDKFMDELYEKLKFEAEKKDTKLLKEMGKIKPIRTLTAKELRTYDLVIVKGMTYEKASNDMGVSSSRIYTMMKNIRQKSGLALEKRPMTVQEGIAGSKK